MTTISSFPNVQGIDAIQINHQAGVSLADQLSDDDKFLIDRDVFGVLVGEQDYIRRLFERNRVEIQAATAMAKFRLQAPFRGIGASDSEIGVRMIRASDVIRSTASTETPVGDWTIAFTSGTTTMNWIGYSSANNTAINIDKRILICWLGVMFTQGGAPVVEELYTQVGGLTLPIESIRHAWISDNNSRVRVVGIRPKFFEPKQTVFVQARSSIAGTNELVMLGLTFALGSYLRLLLPGSVQT